MFNLLIVVISIALVIVLAAAVTYYGSGELLNKGKEEALIAEGINEISQIQSAIYSFHALKEKWPENLEQVKSEGFIRKLPDGWEEHGSQGGGGVLGARKKIASFVKNSEREEYICTKINEGLRINPPDAKACSEVGGDDTFIGCCIGEF